MMIQGYKRGQIKKRTIENIRYDVLGCIYQNTEKKLKKSQVLVKSNTNCNILNRILFDFEDAGLINKINRGSRVTISMTDKGILTYNKTSEDSI